MSGLSPEQHRLLNIGEFASYDDERRTYADLRRIYGDDSLALEQIDIHDNESPYSEHMELLRQALKTNDEEAQLREEKWFDENYPLTREMGRKGK
jgi:hypothetical protein